VVNILGSKSTESLKSIYNEIDKLEKVSIEESGFSRVQRVIPYIFNFRFNIVII